MSHIGLPNWQEMYNIALAKDYVDGATITVEWNAIEPRPRVYNWTALDRWVQEVVRLHKKLSIGIIAGMFIPDWVYASGVTRSVFRYDRAPPRGICTEISQPSVWEPAYLQAYRNALADLAQHLRSLSVPGFPTGVAYQALRIIKISGVNLTTEELRIDAHAPGGPCNEPNTADIWARAGYTPDKMLGAFMTIANDTARFFPDKLLSIAIIHKGGFPPIDNDGTVNEAAVTDPIKPDPMMMQILRAAEREFGSRLLVQWNALSQFVGPGGRAVLPEEMLDARARGAQIGWQLNGFLGIWGGSGCVYLPFRIQPCKTVADFQKILENGIDNGARYLEIQPVNASIKHLQLPANVPHDFSGAFRAAHTRLQN
jgi:hypothetical protein